MPRPDRQPRRRLGPQERRETIIGVATDQFAARPYPDVSMAGVARLAGASEALVHKYFDTKAALYAEVLRDVLADLGRRWREADKALPPNTSSRDRVRTGLLLYLDHVAAHPSGWASPFAASANDPEAARAVRREAREGYVESLSALLSVDPTPRRRVALAGFVGFLDAACVTWVEAGCPDADRHPLVETSLGALQGAIGDWGR